MQPVQDFRSGGRSTRASYQYTLLGENIDELQDFALRLAERMGKIPILKDVNSDRAIGGLETRVVVDRDRARSLGVPISAIDAALYNAFGQRQVVTLYTERDQRHIVLNADDSLLRDPSILKSIRVPAPGGRQVPLDSLATIKMGNAPLIIAHQGLYPAITLSYNLANDSVAMGDALNAIRRASVDAGQPATIRGFQAGTTQTFRNAQTMQPMLIVAALVAVYIVLGVLYESLVHPFTIIATLPSAGIGALLALLITGEQLTVIATIGLILLIGIVKKNAIMLVDFALSAQRNENMSAQDAMLAACRARFRPIMMTTMAALFGALPLALGTGAGAELRRPLGITIMGGLIFSQAITMYITPVLFVMFDRLTHRWRLPRLRFWRAKPTPG
jgi:multidrug efflux pump subunit AcrB